MGRATLSNLGIATDRGQKERVDIDRKIRAHLRIPPLPKNMHPEFNRERRQKRAEAIETIYRSKPPNEVAYVDAAGNRHSRYMTIAAVDGGGTLITVATILGKETEIAEEAAIAIACVGTKARYIISDSKTAIQNFSRGRVNPLTTKILTQGVIDRTINIIWTPAHESVSGNEAAHSAARDLYLRAVQDGSAQAEHNREGRLISYQDITEHYRQCRRRFPPPNTALNRGQAMAWRRLQTGVYPNPVLNKHIRSDCEDDKCKKCGARGTLDHIIWECAYSPGRAQNISSREAWETLLRSSDPELQLTAVQLAAEAAGETKPASI